MKGINQFNEGTTDQARQVAKQGLERRLRRGAPDQDFQQGTTDWKNRSHFFGIAAQAMRRILVDHARSRGRDKRSGGDRVTLEGLAGELPPDSFYLIAVDDALRKLEALEPRQARVVEARFFAGLDVDETAESLGISAATVKRDWTFARAFLQRELDEGGDDRAGKIIAG